MQALIKFFGRIAIVLLSVVGLAVWLGVTAVLAYQGVLRFVEGEAASEKIGGAVMAAGIVLALVGSVLLLRVAKKLIPAVICALAGAFAFFSGGQFNPVELAQDNPAAFGAAVALFLVPLGIMVVTRKWAPFLVTLGLLGVAGLGAISLIGVNLGPTFDRVQDSLPAAEEPLAVPPVAEQPSEEAAPAPMANAQPPAMATTPPPTTAAPVTPTPAPRDDLASSSGAGAAAGAAAGATASGQMRTRSLRPPQAAQAAPPPPVGASPSAPSRDDLASSADFAAAAERAERARAEASTAEREDAARAQAARRAEALPRAGAPEPETLAAAPPPTAAAPAGAPSAADFQVGKLRFNKPERMRILQTYTVEATIAGERARTPQATLGDVGPTVPRDIQISTRKVRVELLAAPTDFEIKKVHTVDAVIVTPESAGRWVWQVTPQRGGVDRPMVLQVFGVVENNGVVEGETEIETYRELITVEVTPMDQVREVSKDIVTNWEPVVGALGVLGGAWAFFSSFLAGLRRRKEEAA